MNNGAPDVKPVDLWGIGLVKFRSCMTMKLYGAVLLAVVGGTALSYGADGDGSGSNNPDLLRGSYETGCYAPAFCGGVIFSQPNAGAGVQGPPYYPPDNASVEPGLPVGLVPQMLGNVSYSYVPDILPPSTELDWDVSLRGAYQKNYSGERFEVIVAPSASILHKVSGAEYEAGVSAELNKASDGEYRLSSVALDFRGEMAINSVTGLGLGANIRIEQDSPNSLSSDSDIVGQPIIVSGGAEARISRRFGKFTGELRGSINRSVYFGTQLTGGAWRENYSRNNTAVGTGLRLTREITPIISAYVDLAGARNIYDNISTGLGGTPSNWVLSARGGLSGNWSGVLLADISAGYALTRFDDISLPEVPTFIFDTSLSYNGGRGVELLAAFGSDISVPDPTDGASLRVGYSASISAAYQINDWLRVRANAGAGWVRFVGVTDTENTYSAGLGADYYVNRSTRLTADYSYNLSQSSENGKRDSHRVELGVTFSR